MKPEKITSFGLIGLFIVLMCACLEETPLSDGRFLGTWIPDEQTDTLIFTSDQLFYQTDTHEYNHSYVYSYTYTDITIQYKGPLEILVKPTTHPYELNQNELIIDFSKGCYGFEAVKSKYIRK